MRRWLVLTLAATLLGCGAASSGHHGNTGAHGGFPSGMDASLELIAESWVVSRAGPGFTIVPLATLHCADETRIALVWPAMRGGQVIDDDVVALRVARQPEGDRVVDDWRARDHDSLRARCSGARIERGLSGLPPDRIGPELVVRAREVRDAIASREGERFRRAAILFAQLFDDRAIASEGMPDALTDMMGDAFQIERGEVSGDQITIHYLRRGAPRRETARLIPATGGTGLVVIEIN
jgi:hypothetical protein